MDADNATATLAARPRARVSPIRTSDDLAAAFLVGYCQATRDAYGRDLRAWGLWLRRWEVDPLEAHRAHVETWARSLESDGLAPSTVSRRLSALAGFYEYAVDEELIARSPVARVRRPRVSDESPRLGLARDEIADFLATASRRSARDYGLCCLLALNGLRVSETLAVDAEHLSEERGHRTVVLLRKGASGRSRLLLPGRQRRLMGC